MTPTLAAYAIALLGYLLGSIPFGIILTRLAGAGDLRSIGSGNIGATNVLRTGRKGLAAATLLLDLLKGAVAVMIGEYLVPGSGPIAGGAAFLGHCYPVWLRFRGGKGVATFAGIALALAWPVGLIYAAIWLGVLFGLRYSSLGGMLAAISAPIAALAIGRLDLAWLFASIALIVLWKHRENIARLHAGTEPKIGKKG